MNAARSNFEEDVSPKVFSGGCRDDSSVDMAKKKKGKKVKSGGGSGGASEEGGGDSRVRDNTQTRWEI